MATDKNNVEALIRQSRPINIKDPYDAGWVEGKTILITGGASGFGEGFFRKWAHHGANVIIGDVNDARGNEIVAEVRKTTGNKHLHYIHCNVANWQSQVSFFRQSVKLSPTGGIDAVVANAGISDGAPFFYEVPDYDAVEEPPAPVYKCFEVNLVGVMYTSQLALHYLSKNPKSAIPNTSLTPAPNTRDRHLLLLGSIASLGPIPGQVQYCVSKHGVLGLFRSLRSTAFVNGVRVNILLPYFIDTPILPAVGRLVLAGSGMGKPEDVIDAGTRLMADTRIVGRSLAIGPKVRIDDDWQVISPSSPNGTESAVWEAYAEDFVEVEAFTRRFIGAINQVEVIRGWVGWATDVLLAFAYPVRNMLRR
ncbi:NAD(P)-binding Rossmann-fold containing protein [Glarea lozoyensis ATCC 20868]|uniref:NAD(P)-binding Rossmann-fold containing protein n=1 Tax=Glarea lozoyensis (strain ATCC 20868 / MF5171) TaxID=1116229 RepID=S3D4U6_GLAL2|nr:NAD(P)-binding Rossmann-fold containing protein [Glarea lozoyensis ATCC 20868]EPE32129.1 NAD(P)-binding Rossmann-fold containing protein [Glarea lozoyensis ATCC 20868]